MGLAEDREIRLAQEAEDRQKLVDHHHWCEARRLAAANPQPVPINEHQAGTDPGQGAYRGVEFSEYCRWPFMNNSTLSVGRRSMRHLKYAIDGEHRESTPSMEFGTLCHASILEPKSLHSRYCVMPDLTVGIVRPDGTPYSNVRATKAYEDRLREWQSNETRIPISQSDMTSAICVLEAVQANARAAEWLGFGSDDRPETELCLVWNDLETGIQCKARVDAIRPDRRLLIDVKTTSDAMGFGKSIATYGYHRQAAFYCAGAAAVFGGQPQDWTFAVIVVESERPCCVRSGPMGERAVIQGRREVTRLMRQLSLSRLANKWPGYPEPDEWDLPTWYETDPTTLRFNGEPVEVS